MIRSYSLPEVAEQVLPSEWSDAVRWLQRRLRRGEIPGYKVGHSWRMTDAHIDALVARYSNTVGSAEPTSVRPLSFTGRSHKASLRRRAS